MSPIFDGSFSDEHDHTHADGTVHSHNHTHSHESTKAVKNRLALLIGHLRSVEKMIENERDCAEVLIQLAAIRSALNSLCKIILRDHMEHCVIDAVRSDDTEALEELNKAIDLLMK